MFESRNTCTHARTLSDPMVLTGSDDCSAKLWDIRWKNSVTDFLSDYQVLRAHYSHARAFFVFNFVFNFDFLFEEGMQSVFCFDFNMCRVCATKYTKLSTSMIMIIYYN